MAGDATKTIETYWGLQSRGEYSAMAEMFGHDAVLVDPILGEITGREAIADYIAKVEVEIIRIEATFTLDEVAGDGDVAWAQWNVITNRGSRRGCGIYRVHGGEIVYYRDYMNSKEFDGQR